MNVVRRFTVNRQTSAIIESMPNDNRPYVTVQLNHLRAMELLHTGATSTLIERQGLGLLKKLNLKVQPITRNTVITADGAAQVITGSVDANVRYDGRRCLLKILIIPSLKHKLILVVDFGHLFHLNVEFANNRITAADACTVSEPLTLIV